MSDVAVLLHVVAAEIDVELGVDMAINVALRANGALGCIMLWIPA
jgi:hypothetical protein